MKHFDVKWPQIFVFNWRWNKLILLSQLCLSTWSTCIKIAFKPVRISGCHIRKISEYIFECNITWNKKMTAVSPLIHDSDKVLISLYNLSLKSNVQVTRIKEMISNWQSSSWFYKFSLLDPLHPFEWLMSNFPLQLIIIMDK